MKVGKNFMKEKIDLLKNVPMYIGDMNKPKPKCYISCDNDEGKYTKCEGPENPQDFALNDCDTCCWLQTYEDLVGREDEEY